MLNSFEKFPHLPTEIRLKIWKQAVCNTSSCGVIWVIVNFDLNHTLGIIPHPKPTPQVPYFDPDDYDPHPYYPMAWDDEDSRKYSYSDDSDNDDATDAKPQTFIPAEFHVCRESREVALKSFRLDIISKLPEENEPWWDPAEDIVYLPSLKFSSRLFEWRPRILSSIQHLALPLDRWLIDRLQMTRHEPPVSIYNWFLGFAALQSVTFLVNPRGKFWADRGKILLYEPYDVQIEHLHNLTPSRIEKKVLEEIASLRESLGLQCELPMVEVLVMGISRGRRK